MEVPRLVVDDRVVGIAVEPALPGLCGRDHGVLRALGVLRRVMARRVVAAARSAALLAGPEMDPLSAGLDAVLALAPFRVLDRLDRLDVATGAFSHFRLLATQDLVHERDCARALANRR